jgi:hypothetical protein
MVQDTTTVGVRPLRGLENDPATKGDTPDDRRADDIHLAEPKEITKEKAAKAQQEPPDLQVCQSPHPSQPLSPLPIDVSLFLSGAHCCNKPS